MPWRRVGAKLDRLGRGRLVEARPAGARVELGVGAEQVVAARRAAVHAVFLAVRVLARERWLGPLPAQDLVLLRRQLPLPLLVGLGDLRGHAIEPPMSGLPVATVARTVRIYAVGCGHLEGSRVSSPLAVLAVAVLAAGRLAPHESRAQDTEALATPEIERMQALNERRRPRPRADRLATSPARWAVPMRAACCAGCGCPPRMRCSSPGIRSGNTTPNRWWRRYGTDRLMRDAVDVLGEFQDDASGCAPGRDRGPEPAARRELRTAVRTSRPRLTPERARRGRLLPAPGRAGARTAEAGPDRSRAGAGPGRSLRRDRGKVRVRGIPDRPAGPAPHRASDPASRQPPARALRP